MNNTDSELQPGKSYQRPKHWGDNIQEGDIFQFLKENIKDHPQGYVIGTFYIAKRTLTSGDRYPDFPSWDEKENEFFMHAWSGVKNLSMFLDNNQQSGNLYANGLNQLAVNIFYTPIDKCNNAIPLSPEVEKKIASTTTLNNYLSGKKSLPTGWQITTTRGKFFTSPVGTQPDLNAGLTNRRDGVVVLYVACVPNTAVSQISLGTIFMLPGGEEINNWRGGEYYVSVTIGTLQPVVYTTDNTSLINVEHYQKGASEGYTSYYFFPKDGNYGFSEVKISDGLIDKSQTDGAVAYKCYQGGNLRYIYIWNVTPTPETKSTLGWDPYISAVINDRPGSITMTRTWQYNNSWWAKEEINECKFIAFDRYGNSGRFKTLDGGGLYGDDNLTQKWYYYIHVGDDNN
ncbi:hypothetical protein MF265_01470 [Serratia marcescens]|uniref:hypothetical protein n=1 Tax=Serratia marcescens TaxID=615 RepID=UPI001EEF8D55|nr:hypothetical protein [Serratia marcescens]ULH11494.1 hypothetical protein MF265_01470 [Serratia marcescens]